MEHSSSQPEFTGQVLSSSQGSLALARLVLGLGLLGRPSAPQGVACEFACCFAYLYPQTSVWVGSPMAESAELPGWALSWHLSSPEGPAFPKAPVPPCQLLSVLSIALCFGSTENQVAGT